MYDVILTIHLAGAGVTAFIAAGAGAALWHRSATAYRPHAIVLGAIAGFEILTGIVLAIVSPEITALSLCTNIALYLGAIFALEALIFARLRESATAFPRLALSPIALSLVLFAGAIGVGV